MSAAANTTADHVDRLLRLAAQGIAAATDAAAERDIGDADLRWLTDHALATAQACTALATALILRAAHETASPAMYAPSPLGNGSPLSTQAHTS